ncbi:Biotin--protein ligase [Sarcoptes scabiei]|uniref:Biotin--protein ligase n=1 Tax=Sarcoptes scabiei TaxID=52283 RepID=A0A834VBF1_SARSC|nr:Biotin--protein ligase [Sarcoptes scabiei]
MSHKFLREKARPNIIVYFMKITLPKSDESARIDQIRSAITKIYGQNRFVVYSITENEIKVDSRFLAARALLVITDQCNNEFAADTRFNKEKDFSNLILNYRTLFQNEFNFDYFREKIKTLIPDNEAEIQKLKISNLNTNIFFIDSQRIYLKWHMFENSMKLIDYCDSSYLAQPLSSHESGKKSNNADCIYLIDWLSINSKANFDEINFDFYTYFDNLQTNFIGRSLLFTEVTTTTMTLINHLKLLHGIVATANYQTIGQGRNENQWLSPFGCAMFTINLRFPFVNPVINRISLIQHIASLSIVLALPNKKLKVAIKWPNDILFVESMSKLAGILVRSYSYENYINIQIGIGVNVSNQHPTICLDDIIQNYNEIHPDDALKKISREEMIAKILNNFERLYLKLLNNEIEDIKRLYCQNWIHSEALIDVHRQSNETPIKAEVIGIDDNGYLLAKELNNMDNIIALQPDGNRFDMMNRLTAFK